MEPRETIVERKRIPKPNNVVKIQPGNMLALFRWWCIFLRPFIYLTDREIEILSCFLKHRFELSRIISDQNILDKTVMSNDVKRQVREECNISLKHFYVIESKLTRKGVIKDKMLNPKVVPNLKPTDSNVFQFVVWFDGFDMEA